MLDIGSKRKQIVSHLWMDLLFNKTNQSKEQNLFFFSFENIHFSLKYIFTYFIFNCLIKEGNGCIAAWNRKVVVSIFVFPKNCIVKTVAKRSWLHAISENSKEWLTLSMKAVVIFRFFFAFNPSIKSTKYNLLYRSSANWK